MQNKRELLEKVINNEEVDRVPCGFWHHFILGRDQFSGLENPHILDETIMGHKKYFDLVQPDMMKLMNEGFFGYPPIMESELRTEEELLKIHSIGKDHPWITEQVKHVKRLVDMFKKEVLCFYNVFSPLQMLRIKFDFLDHEYNHFVDLAEKYPEALKRAGKEIQKDVEFLLQKLAEETDLDGIYFCVQNVQSPMYDQKKYEDVIGKGEQKVLDIANHLWKNNILHICGYARHTNNFSFYKDYQAKVYNWAVHTENISIEEGKKYFGGACVLGGFDNNTGTVIDTGTKEELEEATSQLVRENGYQGYILGADCSIPNDIDDHRIQWICDYARQFRNNKEN